MLPIRRTSRCGRTPLCLEILFNFFRRRFSSPNLIPSRTIERHRRKLAVVEHGQHQLVTNDDRRRKPARYRDLPLHIFLWPHLDRRLLILSNSRSARPPKLRPHEWPTSKTRGASCEYERCTNQELHHVDDLVS